jgi:hypothetical protein
MDGIENSLTQSPTTSSWIGAFLVPVGIVAVTSYFSHKRLELIHRERLAAIEKGLPAARQPARPGEGRAREKRTGGRTEIAANYLRTADSSGFAPARGWWHSA